MGDCALKSIKIELKSSQMNFECAYCAIIAERSRLGLAMRIKVDQEVERITKFTHQIKDRRTTKKQSSSPCHCFPLVETSPSFITNQAEERGCQALPVLTVDIAVQIIIVRNKECGKILWLD